MTFPQPSSTQPVKDGQQFFRLFTPIVSSGDLYESEVSALGVVLGPDSDIARVLVTYLDPDNKPFNVSQVVVSPDRSFSGLISALNTEKYPSAFDQANHRKGRILISIDDLYNPRFRPTLFNGVQDVITFETPNLDAILYFKNLPSVVPPRSDRTFTYQYLTAPLVPGHSSYLVIPAYGRKSGFFTFNNLDGINTVTADVLGVKLQPTSLGTPAGGWQKQLYTNALIAPAAAQYVYKASTDGLWDLFVIQLENYAGAAMPMTITLSDDPQ